MRILVLDKNANTRATVVARLEEALRQAELRRVDLIESEPSSLGSLVAEEPPDVCFIGPGSYGNLEEDLRRYHVVYPKVPVAVVLSNEVYAAEGVELRRTLKIRVIPVADIGQMAQFILDVDIPMTGFAAGRNRGIIAVTQLKGGVGATTVASSLAACWARNGIKVALVDFDNENPQLTDWARVGLSQRRLVSESIRQGEAARYRVRELLFPVEGFNEQLWVFGQPEHYGDSFHFKADVLENAPSIAGYVTSLLESLKSEFDVVVLDTGRSWGISTFAAFPMCQKVVLVMDDDAVSVRRSLESFARIHRETDDPSELDAKKWSFVLNAFTGKVLSEAEVQNEIRETDLFPEAAELFTLPYSAHGREWALSSQSFFDIAEPGIKASLCQIAYSFVPFQFMAPSGSLSTLLRRRLRQVL